MRVFLDDVLQRDGIDLATALFSESTGRVLVAVPREEDVKFTRLCEGRGYPVLRIGVTDAGGPDGAAVEVQDSFVIPLDEVRETFRAPMSETFGPVVGQLQATLERGPVGPGAHDPQHPVSAVVEDLRAAAEISSRRVPPGSADAVVGPAELEHARTSGQLAVRGVGRTAGADQHEAPLDTQFDLGQRLGTHDVAVHDRPIPVPAAEGRGKGIAVAGVHGERPHSIRDAGNTPARPR